MVKRWLKWIIELTEALLVGAGLLLLAFWALMQWPGILVNPRTLGWASSWLQNSGIYLNWENVDLTAESLSFFEKRVRFEFAKPCLNTSEVDLCAEKAEAGFLISLKKFPPEISRIENVDLRGADLAIVDYGGEKPQKSKREKRELPFWIEDASVGPVHVELKKWRFDSPGLHAEGDLDLDGKNADWILTSKSLIKKGKDVHRFRVETHARLNGKVLRMFQPERLVADLQYFAGGRRVKAKWTAEAREKAWVGTLSGEVLRAIDEVPAARLKNCEYTYQTQRLNLSCPMQAEIKIPTIPGAPASVRLPGRISVVVRADLDLEGDRLNGEARIDLNPFQTSLLHGRGSVGASFNSFSPAELATGFQDRQIETWADMNFHVPNFQSLVRVLEPSIWAVPAPFHVLRGKVDAAIQGGVNFAGAEFPVALRTRLTSKDQELDVRTEGQLNFDENAEGDVITRLDLSVYLDQVILSLPRLDLGAPPRFLPDSRFVTKEEEEGGEADNFFYRIRFLTRKEPAYILSNLAQERVPVRLDVTLQNDAPVVGWVEIGGFPAKAFRREANIEKVRIDFEPIPRTDKFEMKLGGRVKVKYTDYTVFIDLGGTVKAPRLILSSQPPLPENEIASVLLYGQTFEELDPIQSESVRNVRGAVADRALSLVSLYALASTPVQSVGYDPNSGYFHAKVRLAEGISLNVGGDPGEYGTVGIQKRLGRFWTFVTEVTQMSGTDERSLAAFLEWRKRY